MSEQPNNPSNSEEIDLGQLFKLIGDAFNRFFNFIGSIFKGVFNLLIGFLIFLQKHFIKFAIAGVIGVAGGLYWDSVSEPIYKSTMVVEPNFNSAKQLYNNIEYYNELADKEEFETLKETFPSLSLVEAKSIKKFEVESFTDQSQKIKQFSSFISSLDTISQQKVDYDDYLKNFNDIDSRFHQITVEAKNRSVAKKLQTPIVSSIEFNNYFKLQKRINDENLQLNDSLYRTQLTEIKSLQAFYKEIKLKEADKEQSSTSISMGDAKERQSEELMLIQQEEAIKNSLVSVNNERANKEKTINVISAFPSKGVEVNDWYRSKIILMPVLLIGMVFGFLMLLELNKYLNRIKKR